MKVDRLLAIILLMQSRKMVKASELARIFEVAERTIYRDIESLKMAGVPVVPYPGSGGGYRLMDNYRLEPMLFTTEEAVSLFLGGSIIEQYRKMDIADAVKRALIKLESVLSEEQKREVEYTSKRIVFDMSGWSEELKENPLLKLVTDGMYEDRRLMVNYNTSCQIQSTQGKVDPYGLVCKNGMWLLIGYCHQLAKYRHFSLKSIRGIKVLEEKFLPDQDFDVQGYWSKQLEKRSES